MKKIETPTITLTLGFADKNRALALLRSLDAEAAIEVHLMKARITEYAAWLELELVGDLPRLREVASLLNEAASVKDPGWRPMSKAS